MTPDKLNVNDVEHVFTFPNHAIYPVTIELKTPILSGSIGEIHGFTFIASPRMTPFERWFYRKDRLALNRRKKQRRATTGRRK